MNPGSREGWPPHQQGPNQLGGAPENEQQSRPAGGFGPPPPQQQSPSAASAGPPVLPPPTGPYFSSQQSAPTLPALPSITQPTQSSPSQPTQRPLTSSQEGPPAPPAHGSGMSYPLPAMRPSALPPSQGQPGPNFEADRNREREKELRDREAREQEHSRMQRDEMSLREKIQRERELREHHQAQQPSQGPRENHTSPMQLHQPVAVAPNTHIHGPGGLLGNPAAGPPPGAIGPQPNPVSNFASVPAQQVEGAQRMVMGAQAAQPPAMMPLGGPAAVGGPPPPANQGQQPILNDALSYLDQVKVQFKDHPDVYNRFLDIMKDFKGGTIDTPGVIERVSSLFAGHPTLIQGFNTFLPPGYKIECGTSDDPNSIRVTTPMGTTVSQMPLPRSLSNPRLGPVNGTGTTSGDAQYLGVGGAGWQTQRPGQSQQDSTYGGSGAPFGSHAGSGVSAAGQPQEHLDGNLLGAANQDHRTGGLQAGASATGRPGLLSPANARSSTPLAVQALNANGAAQAAAGGADKRGPVEFNHAISYVNKIKNRYASQPDIYKQFLEILQTYQRESKPIQDVYAQVTELFNGAPDLLEDFKQFLPESAAQARAAAARQAADDVVLLSNVRTEGAFNMNQQTPRPDSSRLPPVGNFAATPALNRDNKRKRNDRPGAAGMSVVSPLGEPLVKGGAALPVNSAKRSKQTHPQKPSVMSEQVTPISPTLTPALPHPLPPSTSATATGEELAFFDRVRKHIGNKNMMNEFLKLCNLFTQDMMDKNLLTHRIQAFIGGNAELMNYFKAFVGYEETDLVIENRARVDRGRAALAHCRSLGPSYRLLPKQERNKLCSGRDDLCHQVLNDDWASHPTWASEDSGFIAHRKNAQEELLHRIEEERHDYDFNIKACERTVQLLEPIARQIKSMSSDELGAFQLAPGLGGQSETIPRRVIKKIYGPERGYDVIEAMFARPYSVIPTLLNRLKQKVEEWKAAQREWEKIWREQTHKTYYKSLDHQLVSLRFGTESKRVFQPKNLQNEIFAKAEEQRRMREVTGLPVPTYQMLYEFSNFDTVCEVVVTILAYTSHSHANDHDRLVLFFKEFIPLFFGYDAKVFWSKIDQLMNGSGFGPPSDDEAMVEDGLVASNAKLNGKRGGLLRDVLDRNRSGRGEVDGSVASASRDTTPEASSVVEEEAAESTSALQSNGVNGVSPTDHWIEISNAGEAGAPAIPPDQPFKRTTYPMYSNLTIYCFFHVFAGLYQRLEQLKSEEQSVHEQVALDKRAKPAKELKMTDKEPEDYWNDTSPTANYYKQILEMIHEQLRGELDMPSLEEVLRRWYLHSGYKFYLIDRMMGTLVRGALAMMNNDAKDRSHDIYNLFKKDRLRDETTYQDELHYRKQVEKCVKEADLYRISMMPSKMKATVRLMKKEDLTVNPNQLLPESTWKFYVASWQSVDVTEGVDVATVSVPFIKHKLKPLLDADNEDSLALLNDVRSQEALKASITFDYRIKFSADTGEQLTKSESMRREGVLPSDIIPAEDAPPVEDGTEIATGPIRKAINDQDDAADWSEELTQVVERFVADNEWMKGLEAEEVVKAKKEFEEQINGSVKVEGDADVEMKGT